MEIVFYIDILFMMEFVINLCVLKVMQRISRRKIGCIKQVIFSALAAAASVLALCLLYGHPTLLLFGGFMPLVLLCLPLYGQGTGVLTLAAEISVTAGLLGGGTTLLAQLTDSVTGDAGAYRDFLNMYGMTMRNGSFPEGSLTAADLSEAAVIVFIVWVISKLSAIALQNMERHVRRGRTGLSVKLRIGDCIMTVKGLLDTGNMLADPIYGKPAVIIDKRLLLDEVIICGSSYRLEEFIKARPERRCFLPYRSIGKQGGLMQGFFIDELEVSDEIGKASFYDVPAAIAEQRLTRKEEYMMLVPSDYMAAG